MFLRDILSRNELSVSFEFFPPKTPQGEENLWQVISEELAPLKPTFVSVTYGAGGSTRDRTIGIVKRIAAETDITPMAHLTTVMTSREEIRSIVDELAEGGVRNILALRGDPPVNAGAEEDVHLDGLDHAIDLVRLVHDHRPGEFSLGVAGFPEVHPDAADAASDAKHLVAKVEAGADAIITQFFFEAQHFWDFSDRAAEAGLGDVPIIPGIMPVTNIGSIERMSQLSGAEFPGWLREKLEAVGDDPDEVRRVGIEEAVSLCRELIEGGVRGLHFYTLNKSSATREIYQMLGLGQ